MAFKAPPDHEPESVLIRTKLQRPPVAPDVLPRARLLSQLDEERERPLTLISAPAGYGKSTLASRWVAARDQQSAWLTLDERDADLESFVSYLVAALRQVFPTARLQTEAILAAGKLPRVGVLARYLLDDVDRLPEPLMVVLDDYHHIRAGTLPNDLVAELLTHPARALHLVIVTRRDPALPLSRLRGRGQLAEVRAADLRFTADEATEFLAGRMRLPIDRATAALLEEKTEGWVTGLRLAGLSLRGREKPDLWAEQLSGSTRHIAEYLVAEVLSQQSPQVERALTSTSILDRFCAPLCHAVQSEGPDGTPLGDGFDPRRFIDWLVETNLFVVPLDDRACWFRYHHLFQEHLQSLLRDRITADGLNALHARASAWFAEAGLIDEAIRHALAGQDVRAATRLAVENRYELMSTSQFMRLSGWLRSLPAGTVAETPLLVSAGAFIGIEHGQDADVYRCYERAERLLKEQPPESEDHAVLKGEVLALRSFIDMAWGRSEAAVSSASQALAALPAGARLIRSLTVFSLAFCHQMAGDAKRAARSIADALSDGEWSANLRARMHFYGAAISYTDGDLPGAVSSCEDCLKSVRGLPFTHTRTFAIYLRGASRYWRNELEEAEADVLDVLSELPAANPSYSANAAFIQACIELARDRADRAEQVLARATAHLQDNDFGTVLAIARAFRVEIALRRHDLAAARRLSRAVDFDLRPPLWFFYVPQLTPLKLELAEGTGASLSRAHEQLVEMDEGLQRIHRTNVRLEVLALLALVCRAQGEETEALEFLEKALGLAEAGPWVRNFVDLGAPMTALLRRLVAHRPEHGFAAQVLSACATAEAGRASNDRRRATSGVSARGVTSGSILTPREAEIVALLGDGLSNQEIADKLFISIDTVKTHLQNAYGKLGTRGRARAVSAARDKGLIPGN